MDASLNVDSLRDLPGTLPNLTITPQTHTSEEDLRMARACADGSSEVFAAIYASHGERMKSIAFNHLGNISDAEDAVQETLLKVHRAATSYSGEASFGTWMYRILINTCYDALRRRKRRPEESPIDATPLERPTSSVD